jgi:TIR domain-containing protein
LHLGNITSLTVKPESLTEFLLRFLFKFSNFYFSPLKIQKWGSKQEGFDKLSNYDIDEIKITLEKLYKSHNLKVTKSKKGNRIYKFLSPPFWGHYSAKKIFISCSHADEYWKDELVKNLSSLREQKLISEWHDREIEAGPWDPQIKEAMENADIFLLVITHNFLASSYITTQEITKAYANYKSGKSKIFPVICDSCDWRLKPITKTEKEFHPVEKREMYVWLGKFQSFPVEGKPIKNWSNPHDGFLDVVTQLRKQIIN